MSEISNHYDRVSDVYETLGEMDGGLCIGNHDFTGWYNTREGRGRPFALSKEWPALKPKVDRVVYATINYTPKRFYLNSWTGYEWTDDGRQWDGDKPMPGYDQMAAYAPFADIDLADDVKHKRPGGDIPQAKIEGAIAMYADGFAELAGGMDHVFALDSVGGAYMMIAPSVTKPIADYLDAGERKLLFKDMVDKLNSWLAGVRDGVLKEYPELEGVFEPDLLNNKNRLYKAPMSVHSSLDGVVTPVDPTAPSYDYTHLHAVDGGAIDGAAEWAREFTNDHTSAVCSLVEGLWPDACVESSGWKEAVSSRVGTLEEEEAENTARNQQQLDDADIPDDLESTDDLDVIKAKIEAINVKDLARDLSDAWDTAPNRDPPRFAASWHSGHNSGTSCFADRDKFVDLSEGGKGGGALKLVARHAGIINHCSESVSGEDSKGRKKYWLAVNELRKHGYGIPRFEGHNGKHPDVLGLYEEPENKEQEREQFLKALKL